jgi:hypothetical protein
MWEVLVLYASKACYRDSFTYFVILLTIMAWKVEMAWKEIRDLLQAPCYMSRGDHSRKIRASKVKTDVGKFSFINRTIADWNRLPERTIGISPVKTHIFRRRVREVKQ